MHVEVRGIDIASERTGRGHPLGFLHGQGTGTQDSGTVRGIAQGIVDRYRNAREATRQLARGQRPTRRGYQA
jgi:hypothetical protein